jgi:hypothetical protein
MFMFFLLLMAAMVVFVLIKGAMAAASRTIKDRQDNP